METTTKKRPKKFTLERWDGFVKETKQAKKLFKQRSVVGALEQGLKYAIEKKLEETQSGDNANITGNLTGNLTT